MSHTRVKTTYEEMGAYGSTITRTLYCHHNHTCDCFTFYDEKGEVESMAFEKWSLNGKDKWDAMLKLYDPYENEWGGELKDGVEYYFNEIDSY